MTLTLQPVLEDDKHTLRNLYSLYLHDLSRYANLDIEPDGTFQFEDLEHLWGVEGLAPLFIMDDNNLIGFMLLLQRPYLKDEKDYSINDIFILNKYRGKGLGKQALEVLFAEKKGRYFVIELEKNKPAVDFWKKIYSQLHIEYEEKAKRIDEDPCLIQYFTID